VAANGAGRPTKTKTDGRFGVTGAELDALTAQVFATPDGKLLLAHLDQTMPQLTAAIRQSIDRMRARWRTGAA
jgi:hypothetical protein